MNRYIKRLAALFISLLLLLTAVGCDHVGLLERMRNPDVTGFSTLTVNLNLTNPESEGVSIENGYNIYLVVPGKLMADKKKQTMTGFMGPFGTNSAGNVKIDLAEQFNFVNQCLTDSSSTESGSLQIVVTTKEDVYMYNPLNAETMMPFYATTVEGESIWGSRDESINIDITDKYPDGVYSLPYPNASFVVKLDLKESIDSKTTSTYDVQLHMEDGTVLSKKTGSTAYWDAPFYTSELAGHTAQLYVYDTREYSEPIEYIGWPSELVFSNDGYSAEGNILKIKLP